MCASLTNRAVLMQKRGQPNNPGGKLKTPLALCDSPNLASEFDIALQIFACAHIKSVCSGCFNKQTAMVY